MLLLSVIVPVYNVKSYINRCLESIVEQLDSRIEIILVDDGSTDGSGVICDDYASKYDAIKVIHQTNKGVSAARNQGLKMAQGEYIAWIDPDDYVTPNWKESILDALVTKNVDILIYDYISIKKWEKISWSYQDNDGYLNKEKLLTDIGEDQIIQSQLWHKIMHKTLFEGIQFPENITCMEDYSVLHVLIENANSIYYIKKSLYYYVYRDSSLVTEINLDKSYQCCLIARERYNYLKERGYTSSLIGYISQIFGFMIQYFKVSSTVRQKYKAQYIELKEEVHTYSHELSQLASANWKFRLKCILVKLNLLQIAVKVKQLKEQY